MFDAIRDRGAKPLNLHRTYAQSPEIFSAYVGLARALRAQSKVPRQYRELVILRTLQLNGGTYELAQHVPMALTCGLSHEETSEIVNWRTSNVFDAKQRSILGYVDAMMKGQVDDATFSYLSQHFDPRDIVDLTLTAAFYAGDARASAALAIPLDDARPASAPQYGAC